MMDIIHVILTSLGSLIVLFILTKFMGYRQISQLSMFDYINGITIGSIAAEMATSLENFTKPLTAMIVYTIVVVLTSKINEKSLVLRRFMTGNPIILLDNGQIYFDNLKRARLDLDEFLIRCRNSGYFDISKIQTAILESNGKVSILPISTDRPATPKDLNLTPAQETMVANVIMDGEILKKNLQHTGNDEKWLNSQLQSYGVSNISDVFLATCDANNKLNVYIKIEGPMKKDLFV